MLGLKLPLPAFHLCIFQFLTDCALLSLCVYRDISVIKSIASKILKFISETGPKYNRYKRSPASLLAFAGFSYFHIKQRGASLSNTCIPTAFPLHFLLVLWKSTSNWIFQTLQLLRKRFLIARLSQSTKAEKCYLELPEFICIFNWHLTYESSSSNSLD